jgi:ABC-type transport system involved in cytochrome bd biosynthesis fused ATPase/permease subunit
MVTKKPKQKQKKQTKNIIKEVNLPDLIGFKKLDLLTKLRISIGTIFALSTLAIIVVFVSDFRISVVLILLSYLLVLIMLIKLLFIKKL